MLSCIDSAIRRGNSPHRGLADFIMLPRFGGMGRKERRKLISSFFWPMKHVFINKVATKAPKILRA